MQYDSGRWNNADTVLRKNNTLHIFAFLQLDVEALTSYSAHYWIDYFPGNHAIR